MIRMIILVLGLPSQFCPGVRLIASGWYFFGHEVAIRMVVNFVRMIAFFLRMSVVYVVPSYQSSWSFGFAIFFFAWSVAEVFGNQDGKTYHPKVSGQIQDCRILPS